MFKKILIILAVLSISVFLLKLYREEYNTPVETFIEGTDTLDLEDKTSIKTNTFVETKKIDPLTYNKKLDNMGKYTEYRKIKNPNEVLDYKVNCVLYLLNIWINVGKMEKHIGTLLITTKSILIIHLLVIAEMNVVKRIAAMLIYWTKIVIVTYLN